MSGRQSVALRLLLLAALCALAYLPTLSIPLIEDDYPNLWESQTFGPPSALPSLAQNSVFRLRATSSWTMWQMWQAFHLHALPYHIFSLLLHIANTWLLFGVVAVLVGWTSRSVLGSAGTATPATRLAGRPATLAFCAAAFFAVAEGHQEAVMWFSAINELWMFFFGMASLLCWVVASKPDGADPAVPGRLSAEGPRHRDRRVRLTWLWLPLSWLLFALSLVSKETAVVFLPLFLLSAAAARLPWKRALAGMIPHVALAAVALASIAQSSSLSFRFSDGSFSLHAPFWLIWPRGMARALGIWGGLALAAVFRVRGRGLGKAACFALAWAGIALAPYSFLTYSRQIPSRQTYLASAGVAMLVGLAFAALWGRLPPALWPARRARDIPRGAAPLAAAIAAVVLLTNIGYLWTKKRAQFIARAAPTEQLIRVARRTDGPIWVRCFPRVPYIAEEAVELGAGRSPSTLIWSESEARECHAAAVFCYQEPTAGTRR